MHFSRSIGLGLAFTGLCALTSLRAASAQNLTYTLSGVTFSDGAVAAGFFDFNPTTQVFSNFNITTMSGVTDSDPGFNYFYGPSGTYAQTLSGILYVFQSEVTPFPSITLVTASDSSSPNLYPLDPGEVYSSGGFSGSGEITSAGVRGVAAGSLLVTNAVPEASTTISFGLLLALGLGGSVIAKRKKASAA